MEVLGWNEAQTAAGQVLAAPAVDLVSPPLWKQQRNEEAKQATPADGISAEVTQGCYQTVTKSRGA